MRTFLVVAAAACLAVVFMWVVPNNAQPGENQNPRCRDYPKNGTEGQCNRWQLPLLRALLCKLVCLRCHGEEVLTTTLGCLTGRGRELKCICVGTESNNGTTTTTTPGPPTNSTPTTPTTPGTPTTTTPTTPAPTTTTLPA